mmetsp:Transcript_34953/g.77726  ORF Transcript_34953/g.77726 Transcript_34953/m.77726 type:complete len:359 (-) Transcript_34953:566-1642(-)
MQTTPSSTLHRVLKRLDWSGSNPLPTDGDVKKKTVNNQRVYFVRAQPRGQHPIRGVSFFEPAPGFLRAIHKHLGQHVVGCVVTVPGTPLPSFMRFVNDKELMLKLYGDDQEITCGQHWTLYTTTEMAASEFEAAFQQLVTSCVPCSIQGNAEAEPDLDVDMDDMPGDTLTRASVMALDHLAKHTEDPNVKLFAHLYALHMRATDMAFEEVLQFGPMASMVAAALVAWTVRDPFLLVDACRVRDHLAATLEMEVAGPQYEPFWAVHPFQFMEGKYTDQLYDEQVKTCALAFVGDEALKALVRDAAEALFAELALSSDMTKYKCSTIVHKSITFEVHCGDKGGNSSGSSRATSFGGTSRD